MIMPKKVKELPQYMQFAYGAQPSPMAGAQLVFLNELTEMVDELKTAIQSIDGTRNHEEIKAGVQEVARAIQSVNINQNKEEISGMIAELNAQIQQSMTGMIEAMKKSQPKMPDFDKLTTSLKSLTISGGKGQTGHEIIESNMNIILRLDALIGRIEKLSKPKEWEFDIQRDSLYGHIVSVTAKQKTK